MVDCFANVCATIRGIYSRAVRSAAEGEVATPEVVGVVKLHFIVPVLGNWRRDEKVLGSASELYCGLVRDRGTVRTSITS